MRKVLFLIATAAIAIALLKVLSGGGTSAREAKASVLLTPGTCGVLVTSTGTSVKDLLTAATFGDGGVAASCASVAEHDGCFVIMNPSATPVCIGSVDGVDPVPGQGFNCYPICNDSACGNLLERSLPFKTDDILLRSSSDVLVYIFAATRC